MSFRGGSCWRKQYQRKQVFSNCKVAVFFKYGAVQTTIDPAIGYSKKVELPLTVGKGYVVYAIRLWQGIVWYYICDDNYSYYPIQTPTPLFEVVDNRVSKYWRFMLDQNGVVRMVFEQWFTAPYFYDKLTDQEQVQVEIFEKVKELMDAEDFDLPPLDVAVEKLRKTVSI